MKNLHLIIVVIFLSGVKLVRGEEMPVIVAVVQELKHDPNSAPLEWQNIPGKEPPVWAVTLKIERVLIGGEKLEGISAFTATADFEPDGNSRVVTPRLKVGDRGIWAIKRVGENRESWAQVYSPYEVEKGVVLPLIEGRHDAYARVLERLSGGLSKTESAPGHNAVKDPVKPTPDPLHRSVQPTDEGNAPIALPTPLQTFEGTSSIPWNYIVVIIVVAFGMLWLLIKRRS